MVCIDFLTFDGMTPITSPGTTLEGTLVEAFPMRHLHKACTPIKIKHKFCLACGTSRLNPHFISLYKLFIPPLNRLGHSKIQTACKSRCHLYLSSHTVRLKHISYPQPAATTTVDSSKSCVGEWPTVDTGGHA